MPADEIRRLAADLSAAGPKMVRPLRKVWQEIGDRTAQEWAAIATTTAGAHGVHYPKSIDAELTFSTNLSVEIGPNPAKPQGGMSFEKGSVNQPPHLDGLKAVDKMTPVVEVMARSAVDPVIP
jgi:hypothetical protein